MKPLTRDLLLPPYRPEKVVQFGEGNFLRACIYSQKGVYPALIRGINEADNAVSVPRVMTSVNRELLVHVADNPDLEWGLSNATKSGIVFYGVNFRLIKGLANIN